MNSLLTIIIPVYRVSNTMDRCIESIVSQKYDNMRIILVDDGSPDDCPEKCDRWAAKDNKITVIHKLNGGLSDARNAGLDIAGGDYITFVDSDDYIHPDTYYDVMHLISQHPEYDILEFPVYKFFGTSGQQLLTFSNKEYHDIADYWMTGQAYDHAYAWNKIYRRRLFDKVRFPVGRVFEDVYTLPQLLEHSKIVATTDKGLYYYCQNDNGITACAQGNELRMLLESHIKVINKYRKHPLFHHYYMHVVNIQICEYEKNGDKPLLRQERIKRLDGLNMKSKLKAITINSLGIKKIMYTDKIYKQYNKTPLVTFIVTCYNLPIWMIKECLESILALSLRPFEREIILVDDGSETSPVNELSGHLDDIIYVRQKNGGLSEARNAGIRMATGLYLQFVDGDDKLIQAGYEHCLDIVRYHDMPDMVLFDLSSKMTNQMTFTEVKPVCGTEYMQHNNIHPSSCGYIVKRTTLGELRFTPGIYHEDEEFTPQLLLRAEIIYPTLATAYFYRRRTGSIISDQNKRSILKRLNDKKQVIIRLNDMSDRLPHNDRTAINRRVAQLTMDYIYNIIIQIHSRKYLDKQLAELHSKGLFPLPDKEYTTKYKWFRRMTNSNMGLTVLMRTLPFLKKER